MKGYDYDGVITLGGLKMIAQGIPLPNKGDGSVIITGRSCAPKDVERTKIDMAMRGIDYMPVYFMPTAWKGKSGVLGVIRTGEWKAMMIDALELDEFFEDNSIQLQAILDYMKGTTKITKV